MKVRTLDNLQEVLDSEYAWRRKELSEINGSIRTAKDRQKILFLRAGVALLYAHWEGFIKSSAEAYLSYVAFRRLRYDQLSPSLLALCLRSKLRDFADSEKASHHAKFMDFLLKGMASNAVVPRANVIRTRANLSADVFKEIVILLGLNYTPYELKENLIDRQLLRWRNCIAHGQSLCPREEEFGVLLKDVANLIATFKDQVYNAAAMSAFLVVNSTSQGNGGARSYGDAQGQPLDHSSEVSR
jgi:hypothetical protein